MNLPATASHLWTERYETLRRHFIENRQLLGADPIGLTRLLRSGVADWMRSWSGAEASPKPSSPASQSWDLPVVPGWQQELTRLIAHMTTQHLQPTPTL